MSTPWIEAAAEGEDVVIHVGANDADRIAWALRRQASHSSFASDYRHMADAIEGAVEQAFENGALPAPGLSFKVVMR